jgi:hypothetical protein
MTPQVHVESRIRQREDGTFTAVEARPACLDGGRDRLQRGRGELAPAHRTALRANLVTDPIAFSRPRQAQADKLAPTESGEKGSDD